MCELQGSTPTWVELGSLCFRVGSWLVCSVMSMRWFTMALPGITVYFSPLHKRAVEA